MITRMTVIEGPTKDSEQTVKEWNMTMPVDDCSSIAYHIQNSKQTPTINHNVALTQTTKSQPTKNHETLIIYHEFQYHFTSLK
jgi:hypothetical protein